MCHDSKKNLILLHANIKAQTSIVHLCRLISALCQGRQQELYCFQLIHSSVCLSLGLSLRCCCHSNLVVVYRISSKFHILVASIKLLPKFEYGFCRTNDKQNWCNQFVCTCGHSNLAIAHRIFSKFYIRIILSNSGPRMNIGLSDEG